MDELHEALQLKPEQEFSVVKIKLLLDTVDEKDCDSIKEMLVSLYDLNLRLHNLVSLLIKKIGV